MLAVSKSLAIFQTSGPDLISGQSQPRFIGKIAAALSVLRTISRAVWCPGS